MSEARGENAQAAAAAYPLERATRNRRAPTCGASACPKQLNASTSDVLNGQRQKTARATWVYP